MRFLILAFLSAFICTKVSADYNWEFLDMPVYCEGEALTSYFHKSSNIYNVEERGEGEFWFDEFNIGVMGVRDLDGNFYPSSKAIFSLELTNTTSYVFRADYHSPYVEDVEFNFDERTKVLTIEDGLRLERGDKYREYKHELTISFRTGSIRQRVEAETYDGNELTYQFNLKCTGFDDIKAIIENTDADTFIASINSKPEPLYADKDPNELVSVASGTGFFINKLGNIVTNEHVVAGCNTMKIIIDGKEYDAEVVATDNVNDLALLTSTYENKDFFEIAKDDIERSQKVRAVGYGFGKSYSSDIKVTAGEVNSLSGYNDNYSEFQMDAAIQSGNSGGPVINESGTVVGVSVAALDSIAVLEDTGTLPQNVNYAIKASTLKQFLNAKDVEYSEASEGYFSFWGKSDADINNLIDSSSVYLSCLMTYAEIEENLTTKVMFENIE